MLQAEINILELEAIINGLRNGDRRSLARAITKVESDSADGREILRQIYPHTGRAHTIGITGSAGAGKSTLVGALARVQRKRGKTVGIVAVDPSSPFSHGAILGDRIRMQDLTSDDGVFLRSMASRGNLGGLSEMATGAADLMDAAGLDVVLIETVGAGQDEVEVATAAQTTVLVANPGAGDEVQSMKAGLMEIAQIMVVNKADLVGADTAVAQLKTLLAIADHGSWIPPILKTIAKTDEGIDMLADEIQKHFDHMRSEEHFDVERRNHVRGQIIDLTRAILQRRLIATTANDSTLETLINQVAERQRDPRSAALELADVISQKWSEY
ncbi:MAG: methylmalonyl Co-A mutase-associated GTPase MeaB [Dehalococcoidia bacterium]|nr:methylmalonyl Co-A mutase-associated GTPase MeaB [Dehalococcoidia bacterium]